MKKRRYLLLTLLLVLGAGQFLLFWNAREIDLSSDEAPFNRIAMPPQSVRGDYFMDGGSVWVHIVDRNGKTIDLVFPADNSGGLTEPKYERALHVSMNYSGDGSVSFWDPPPIPLRDPQRARDIALDLLRVYGKDDGAARAYDWLSKSNSWIGIIVRRILFSFN